MNAQDKWSAAYCLTKKRRSGWFCQSGVLQVWAGCDRKHAKRSNARLLDFQLLWHVCYIHAIQNTVLAAVLGPCRLA